MTSWRSAVRVSYIPFIIFLSTVNKNPYSLSSLKNCAACLLSRAVLDLFSEGQLIRIGVTDAGFFSEFSFPKKGISSDQLISIEERMKDLIRKDEPLISHTMLRQNLAEFFRHHGQFLRAQMLGNGRDLIHVLEMYRWKEVCPEPHVSSLKFLKIFILNQLIPCSVFIPGKGEIKGIRIQGAVFSDSKELRVFQKNLKLKNKVEHEKLGEDLALFLKETASGIENISWLPRGLTLKRLIRDSLREERGVMEVKTPHWVLGERGGRPQVVLGDRSYFLSPSLFLQHWKIFLKEKSLPLRLTETQEEFFPLEEWQVNGLFRSTSFEREVTHIFCLREETLNELISSLHLLRKFIKILDFKVRWILHKKANLKKDAIDRWNRAVETLLLAYEKCVAYEKCEFSSSCTIEVEEADPFIAEDPLGPSLLLKVSDLLGNEWTIAKLSLFVDDVKYLRHLFNDKLKEIPSVISRSAISLERIIALLIEKTAGDFPFCLNPEQFRLFPLMKAHVPYALKVEQLLKSRGFRVGMDLRGATLEDNLSLTDRLSLADSRLSLADSRLSLAHRLSDFKKQKVPYGLILGDEEVKNQTVYLRIKGDDEGRRGVDLEQFLREIP